MKYIMILTVLLFSMSCQAADDDQYAKYGGDEGKYSQCDPLSTNYIKNYRGFRMS